MDAEKSVGGKRYGPAEQEIGSVTNGTRSGEAKPRFTQAGNWAGRRHQPDCQHLSNVSGWNEQPRPAYWKFSFSRADGNRQDPAGGSGRRVSAGRRPLSSKGGLRRVSAQP